MKENGAKWPWFQFWGYDFFADEKVKVMTSAQRGMYLALLWHEWAEGSIPSPYLPGNVVRLGECLGIAVSPRDFHNPEGCPECLVCQTHQHTLVDDLREVIDECFIKHPTLKGRLINKRLEAIRIAQVAEKEWKLKAAHAGGQATARLKLGDSQATVKQKPRRQQANPNPESESLQKEISSVGSLRMTNEYPCDFLTDPSTLTYCLSKPTAKVEGSRYCEAHLPQKNT